jgi:hypothetical protein
VENSETWLTGQLTGDYLEHVCAILQKLVSEKALIACDFQVPAESYVDPELDQNIIVDDEFADLLGQFCLALSSARLRRGMWMFGWPTRMVSCLKSDEIAKKTISLFKEDLQIWEAFLTFGGELIDAECVLKQRHVFNLTVNLQYASALGESDFEYTPDIADLCRRRCRGIISTQGVEDMQGEPKNANQVRGSKNIEDLRPLWELVSSVMLWISATIMLRSRKTRLWPTKQSAWPRLRSSLPEMYGQWTSAR